MNRFLFIKESLLKANNIYAEATNKNETCG